MNRRWRSRLAGVVAGLIIVVLIPGVLRLVTQDGATGGTLEAPETSLRASDVPLVADGESGYPLRIQRPERLPMFEVDRIIDGDTLDVRSGDSILRIRVFGLAAPERADGCGPEATEAMRRAAGDRVRLLADERLEDQYGRLLRYVFTPDGRSVDAALIADGAAEAWHEDGAYREQLVGLEEAAREGGSGCLWG